MFDKKLIQLKKLPQFNILTKKFNNFIKKFNEFNLLTRFFFILILIALYFIFIKNISKTNYDIEGFENNIINLNKKNMFEKKYNNEIYDDFYAKIYNTMYSNNKKNEEEIKYIKLYLDKFNYTKILDIGCGTGNHVNLLNKKYNITGIDNSESMINIAKTNYPDCNFVVTNFLDSNFFDINTYTHIICLNRTLYEFDDKNEFFEQCDSLLNNAGYLIINIIDINNFNTFLTEETTSIKKYKLPKKNVKITESIVKMDKNTYMISKFDDSNLKSDNTIIYHEKFKNEKTNSVRNNEITYKLESKEKLINMAKANNLYLKKIIQLKNYKNEFLYIFTKKIQTFI